MFYEPPKVWSEELLDELPFGEDDRYERKSGDDMSQNNLDEFIKKLAKEIGAFANSFGGTLFIGIADDRKKVGVPAIAKGRTPTERWLENKIPTLFELRLQHFRISRVELSEKTQNQIGGDKIIVAIDVYHSELAPHQCVFDQKYYYRSNSESRPAPHHYLAFLWGRANSNMSQVATWWLKDFLNPTVDLVSEVQKSFNQNRFAAASSTTQAYSTVYIYRINFFAKERWDALLSSDVGEYFLSTFPSIERALTSFEKNIDDFNRALTRLRNSIEESPVLLKLLIDLYARITAHERIARSQFENSDLQQIAPLLLGQLHLQISNYATESKDSLVRFSAYSLLELGIHFQANSQPDDQKLLNICKEVSDGLRGKDDSISKASEETKQLFDVIKSESTSLWERLKKERIDLARRYTATFGQ